MAIPKLVRYLDPRPSSEAERNPIAEAVNVPLEEMPDRMHELPARHGPVVVAGLDPLATRAVAALNSWGREAELAKDWKYGDSGPGRLWEPNPFLIEIAGALAPGSALDLACGSGRDAVALAGMGWQVSAIDHLEDALDRGRDLARRYLPFEEERSITWTSKDLESHHLSNTVRADLVSMFWYLNRPLVRSVVEELPPGGSLVLETFTNVHRERYGKPRTEAFVLQPGELRELVQPLTVRFYEEDWHGDRHSARIWATK